MKLWVDDVRPAPRGYRWVKSVNEAIRAIKDYEVMYIASGGKKFYSIDLIDLDHDAGDYVVDGGDYIKLLDWLVETKRFYPVELHTMNPVGRENMQRMINLYWKGNTNCGNMDALASLQRKYQKI